MLIAHLTDFHCVPDGQKLANMLDVNALAKEAVLNVTGGRQYAPDVLIYTGDLTHNADLPSTRAAREALDLSEVPYIAIPGGHDDFDSFAKVFPDQLSIGYGGGAVLNATEIAGHRFVAINTLGKGEVPGWDDPASQELDAVLNQAPDTPTTVVLHHPPFQCNIAVKTYYKDPEAIWARSLKQVISGHPQVKLMPCGHVHRVFQRIWAGAQVCSGASTAVQVDPDFSAFWETASHSERNIKLVLEPGFFGLYQWDGSEFITYTLPIKRDYPRF